MIARAKAAGCGALLLTVDLAVPGTRYRDYRAGLSGSMRGRRAGWRRCCAGPTGRGTSRSAGRPHDHGQSRAVVGSGAALSDLMGWVAAQFRRQRHLEGRRMGPLAMGRAVGHQGHPRSRRRARGGRQRRRRHRRFQPWRAPARRRRCRARARCRAIADAVAGESPCSPMAACAQASTWCGCSRSAPTSCCWAAAGPMRWRRAGEAGVAHVLKLIEAEMRVAMALTGCTSIGEIDEQILERAAIRRRSEARRCRR